MSDALREAHSQRRDGARAPILHVLWSAILVIVATNVAAETAIYIGPANGSWFVAEHWSTGVIPGPITDVILGLPVVIDQPAGQSRDVSVQTGGAIVMMAGGLASEDIIVFGGGALRLSHGAGVLEAITIDMRSGTVLEWRAGTIRIHQWFRNNSVDTNMGTEDVAQLEVLNGGWFDTRNFFVSPSSAVYVDGEIDADTWNSGLISPGLSHGPMYIDGDLNQQPTGVIQIDIESYDSFSAHDVILVEDDLRLDGTLVVEYEDTSSPHPVQFTILEAVFVTGSFADTQQPDPPGPLVPGYSQSLNAVTVGLTVYGARIYVDADAAGGFGSSWQDAFQSLDDALTAAALSAEVMEVWVAEGNYIPSLPRLESDPLTASFRPPANVPVYGGFAGTEDTLDERDVAANPTVLNADRLGDDLPDFVNYADNHYHVVSAINPGATAILDGLVIRGDNADQVEHYGGGIVSNGGTLEIRNCTITENYAAFWGGGLYITDAPVIITASTIQGNWARRGGGGVSTLLGGTIDSCLFEDNVSYLNLDDTMGGGISVDQGTLHVDDSVFRNNRAVRGGAIASEGNLLVSLHVTNCLFEVNEAGTAAIGRGDGGAIGIVKGDLVEITGCLFRQNTSAGNGGGVSIWDGQELLVDSCEFVENVARFAGAAHAQLSTTGVIQTTRFWKNSARSAGALALAGDTAMFELRNCEFDENAATAGWGGACTDWVFLAQYRSCRFNGNTTATEGGAIVSASDGLAISNCTVTHNSAAVRAGGILYWPPDSQQVPISISNNILWNNDVAGTADEMAQIHIHEDASPEVHYNCIMGLSGAYGGEGNIGVEPRFVDIDGADDVPGSEDDDLHLDENSPCIDSADNFAVPVSNTMDLDGEARRFDDVGVMDTGQGTPPIVDMGADEFHGTSASLATLTDFNVAFGSLISGSLQDLVESDDLRLRTRSIPGFTSEEANLMELRVGAVTTVQSPGTLDLTLEGRISQPGGTVRVRFRNWTSNAFVQIHQYPIGFIEAVETIENIVATNFVRASDGRIEVSMRHSVFATFSVLGFDSFTDQVLISVN